MGQSIAAMLPDIGTHQQPHRHGWLPLAARNHKPVRTSVFPGDERLRSQDSSGTIHGNHGKRRPGNGHTLERIHFTRAVPGKGAVMKAQRRVMGLPCPLGSFQIMNGRIQICVRLQADAHPARQILPPADASGLLQKGQAFGNQGNPPGRKAGHLLAILLPGRIVAEQIKRLSLPGLLRSHPVRLLNIGRHVIPRLPLLAQLQGKHLSRLR